MSSGIGWFSGSSVREINLVEGKEAALESPGSRPAVLPNPDYPLSSITAWDKYFNNDHWFIDAIKTDNSPLTGSVTGDTTSTGWTSNNGDANTAMWPVSSPIIDAKRVQGG